MGAILEPTPDMGEYHVEVRSESFYLSDEHTFVQRSDGTVGYELQRHALFIYRDAYHDPSFTQGTVEILIEDIPKIEAALEQVRDYLVEQGRPVPLSTNQEAA